MTDHQQAAERLAWDAIQKIARNELGMAHQLTNQQLLIETINLPQLLADSARCKELENALECFNIYVHDLTGDAGEDEPLVVMRRYVNQLKSRITELEVEVARLNWKYITGPQGEKLRYNANNWQYQTIFFEWLPWPPKAPQEQP